MNENYEMEEAMKGNSNERRRSRRGQRERERERQGGGSGGEGEKRSGATDCAKRSGSHGGEPIVRKAKGTTKAASSQPDADPHAKTDS